MIYHAGDAAFRLWHSGSGVSGSGVLGLAFWLWHSGSAVSGTGVLDLVLALDFTFRVSGVSGVHMVSKPDSPRMDANIDQDIIMLGVSVSGITFLQIDPVFPTHNGTICGTLFSVEAVQTMNLQTL